MSPLDEVVSAAARVAGVPVAMIGLLDDRAAEIVAAVGWKTATLPNSHSFAVRLAGEKEIVVAGDASADPRFAQHPPVTSSPYVRFFAGIPLVDEAGSFRGALWLADRVPRTLSSEAIDQLMALGRIAVALL